MKEPRWTSLSAAILNSYGMIFFARHRWFSLLLIAVSFLDPAAGAAGLFTVIAANAFAWALGYPSSMIRDGQYGFNAAIVGLGLGAYFSWSWALAGLLIIAGLISFLLTVQISGWLAKYQLPFLSLPFVFTLWLVMLATRSFTHLTLSERGLYYLNELYATGDQWMVTLYQQLQALPIPIWIELYLRSLGAILFQFNLVSGLLLSVGLLLYSRIAFTLSWLGFLTAFLFYQWIGADLTTLSYSYIGFNYILTGIALGGYYLLPSKASYGWIVLLTPVLVVITAACASVLWTFQLPAYALPFNVIVIGFLYVLKWRANQQRGPQEVVLQHYSPERNLYDAVSRKARFANFRYVALHVPVLGKWTITQGHEGDITHREGWRHAWDFEITDETGKPYRSTGTECAHYYCYDKPVVACAAGTVVAVVDTIADNEIGETNLQDNWGNSIVLYHAEGLYSQVSHLKAGSILVQPGDHVKAGQTIARVGNSGRSPIPHLHFQAQSIPEVGATTLAWPLSGYLLHQEDGTQFCWYAIPQKGQVISNSQPSPLLQHAFHLLPGSTLHWQENDIDIEWVCQTDMYNHTYLECRHTGARAWFTEQAGLVYFSAYEGSRQALLFHFYLAAYKVPFSLYKGLVVTDELPLYHVDTGIVRWWHDCIAPFVQFRKATYSLEAQVVQKGLEAASVSLHSTIRLNQRTRLQQTLVIDEQGFQSIEWHEGGQTRRAACRRDFS